MQQAFRPAAQIRAIHHAQKLRARTISRPSCPWKMREYETTEPDRGGAILRRSAKPKQKTANPGAEAGGSSAVRIDIRQSDHKTRVLWPRLAQSDQLRQSGIGGIGVADPQRRVNFHAQKRGIIGIKICRTAPESGMRIVTAAKLGKHALEEQ
jgi:hypothetical protein